MKNSRLILKRVFLCSVIFSLISVCSFGKERKVLYVILTLKDSTVVEGYLRSSSLTDRDFSVKISSDIEGKSEKYKIRNIEKMEIKSENGDSISGVWKPMFVNNGVGRYKGYIAENPVMLLSIYQGKNVNGYVGMIWCLVDPLSGYWKVLPCFYYQLPDMDYAKCFLIMKGTLFYKRHKKSLMREFADYPTLVNMLRNDTLQIKEILKSPMIVIRELDKIISASMAAE